VNDFDVPMPGTCHPAWAHREDMIRSWLDGTLGYGSHYELLIPKQMPVRLRDFNEPPSPTYSMPEPFRFRRQRCCAPAPYVGDPFVYEWDAATDQYGRTVAGLTTYTSIYPGIADD
jgi:hypothetical protein